MFLRHVLHGEKKMKGGRWEAFYYFSYRTSLVDAKRDTMQYLWQEGTAQEGPLTPAKSYIHKETDVDTGLLYIARWTSGE